jgi:hypothetical protein
LRSVARRQATSRPRPVSIATGIGGVVVVLGEQRQERLPTGDVVRHAPARYQRAVGVDQGDVVVLLAPVDPACHLQRVYSFEGWLVQLRAVRGHAAP